MVHHMFNSQKSMWFVGGLGPPKIFFFKNNIGTKSYNSRHFQLVTVAQQENRLSILRRIEFW